MHWRTHQSLKGKLHPSHPDDLQVVVHEGGPRFTQQKPEAVWVTITSLGDGVFTGKVLNKPHQLASIQQHQEIQFIVETGTEHPVMVTEKYLREKPNWRIGPCTKCGFAELFDAPSDLIRVTFPNLPTDAQLEGFTAFCPLCGGVQSVEACAPSGAAEGRAWWKFWSS